MSWDDAPIIGRWDGGLATASWDDAPIVSREETEDEKKTRLLLFYARRRIAGSPIPNILGGAVGMTAGIAGLAQRATGGLLGDPESTARIAGAFEQAAEEEAGRAGKVLPKRIARGVRSVVSTMPTQVFAGMAGGPAAMIGLAASQEANQAITEGQEAGLEGAELAAYVGAQATIEAVPAAIMSKIGLGGFEAIFGKAAKKAVTGGVMAGLKKAGVRTIQELGEENFTELGHGVAGVVADVKPGDIVDWDRIGNTVADTTIATLMQMGVATAPSVGRSLLSKISEKAKLGEAPSKEDARELGIPKEETRTAASRADWFARNRERLSQERQPELVVEEPAEGRPDVDTVAPDVDTVAAEAVQFDDDAVGLSKAEGIQIREQIGATELSDEAVQTFDAVAGRVIAEKADEKAMDLAEEILRKPREISSYEHVAMVFKARNLLNDLDASQENEAKAALASNAEAHGRAVIQSDLITEQLDKLTEATRYSRRELARAMSIGRLRLSRQSYDVVSVLNRLQATKGPEGKVTSEEKRVAARRTKEYADLEKQVEELQQKLQAEEESREAVIAEKVMAANKPRKPGQVGRKIREKAVIEREDIKKRIRQMGLRVNDITGIPVEGTYLIGRLGLTYVKEGAGTLVEIVEKLQADMPDLNLTAQDVYRTLIQSSPKAKTRARSDANKRVTKLTSMARMLVEIDSLANGIAVKQSKREPIDTEVKRLRKELTKAREDFYYLEIEAAKVERAVETVNRLQDQLTNGLNILKKDPKVVSPELAAIHEQIREIRSELRIDTRLAEVNEQLRTGEILPVVKKEKKPVNPRLERKQIELKRKRREIEQMIADAAPWGTKKIAGEVAYTLKALKATADISFTMRQNVVQVFAHPLRSAKAFLPSMEAFFSEYSSDQIQNSLENSENAPLYEQSGVAILDASSSDARRQSEVYRGKVVENFEIGGWRNPLGALMRASSRHAVAVGNLIRTGAFDQFVADNPNVTQTEMRAYADYLNVSTGLGNLGSFGAVGKHLEKVFFAPRFAVSRFQTPYAVMKHWKQPRVRNQIAKDMVGFVATGGTVLMLAAAAGAEVEWLDVDDPDWGKIRAGDMHIDIWGGFQQPARVLARIASYPTKDSSAGQRDPLEIAARFAAFKLSPAATLPIELLKGRTAVGEETTRAGTLARAVVPLVFEDVWDAWKLEGIEGAAIAAPLAAAGVGVSAYTDSESRVRAKMKKLMRAGNYTEANKLKIQHNFRDPENKIVRVKVD